MDQHSAGLGPDADQTALAEASFRDLFTSTYSALLAYARRRTFDAAEADDVVAEVYATAWRRRENFDAERPPLPWLYGIAANVIRNSRRAGGRRLQLVEELQAQPAPAPAAPADEQANLSSADSEIHLALSRLSFDDREVLQLVAWEGLTHIEAAQALDCSPNAVGIRIHRARQRLQSQLEDLNQSPSAERRGGATS